MTYLNRMVVLVPRLGIVVVCIRVEKVKVVDGRAWLVVLCMRQIPLVSAADRTLVTLNTKLRTLVNLNAKLRQPILHRSRCVKQFASR